MDKLLLLSYFYFCLILIFLNFIFIVTSNFTKKFQRYFHRIILSFIIINYVFAEHHRTLLDLCPVVIFDSFILYYMFRSSSTDK